MALISCPNCGNQISDKAKKCVHCGFEFPEEKTAILCSECGAELEDGATTCPKCGCPVNLDPPTTSEPHSVSITGVKVDQKSKKKLSIIAIAAIIILGLIFGGTQLMKQVSIKKYNKTLHETTLLILDSASKAESSGNLIKSVWYNAIYEESDSETDPYTRPDGYFVSDFNSALENLYSDDSFMSDINDIELEREHITNEMKDLKNPPKGYEDAYKTINSFYDSYIKLSNLVTKPTGSLTTFSQSFNEADSEASDCYSKMKVYIE